MAKPGKDQSTADQDRLNKIAVEQDQKEAALQAEADRLAAVAAEQDEREANIAKDMATMEAARRVQKQEIDAWELKTGKPLALGEIGEGHSIELITDMDAAKETIAREEFMNEQVLVLVHKGSTKMGQLEVAVPTVNGINQPIIRGREQWVKRKYIEALARSSITDYEQQVPDRSQPDVINMVASSSPTYAFTVRKDSDEGFAWLNSILEEKTTA